MASDLVGNGQAWDGRTGNDKYGTFYRQVAPPSPNGTQTFTLDYRWGQRVAEISSRAKGYAGLANCAIGGASSGGTVWVPFPPNMFNEEPLLIVQSILYARAVALGSTGFYLAPFVNPALLSSNPSTIFYGGISFLAIGP